MKKSISITFTFDFATRLTAYSLFEIGSNKEYFDQQKTIQDFTKAYHNCYKGQLQSIMEACQKGNPISVYFSSQFIQLLQQIDRTVIENLKTTLGTKNLTLLGGLDRPSLSPIYSESQFVRSIDSHRSIMKSTFGIESKTFYNLENIFFSKMARLLSEQKYTSTFCGAITWYLGSNVHQRVFNSEENDQFKLLLVDADQAKSLFHSPETQQHFLHFNSEQIQQLEGVDAIISRTSSQGKIISIIKQLEINKTSTQYKIKNPVMGSSQGLTIDTFNGNILQNQVLKKYYDLEEAINESGTQEEIALWDKLGHSAYLLAMNITDLNETVPYSNYNQLTNILTDLKLKLQKKS